jgi:tetratricopeptide (TPR) repeat protein
VDKGESLDQLNDLQQASSCYDQAIKLAPNSPWPWNAKGKTLARMENHLEALKLFDKAIAMDKTQSSPWLEKSDSLRKLERLDDAIHCLESALEVVEDRHRVLSALGLLFSDHKFDEQKALEWFRQALAIRPYDVEIKFNIAECLVTFGNYCEGRAYALEVERDSAVSTLQCAGQYLVMVSYALEGDAMGSEKHFRRFIDHFTKENKGQPSVMNWDCRRLIKNITESEVNQETKFVLLTLIDLQLGTLLRSNLTFFTTPPCKTVANGDMVESLSPAGIEPGFKV